MATKLLMLVVEESRKEEMEVFLDRAGVLGYTEIPHALGRTGAWFTCQRLGVEPDILVIGTPIWLGHMSSICQRVIERLELDAIKGSFPGMTRERTFQVVLVSQKKKTGFSFEPKTLRPFKYEGKAIRVFLKELK